MTLLFVRHGQTEWNARRWIQGRTDIPLNEMGREQARAQAKALVGTEIDVIYASPMLRARETAEIIQQASNAALCFDERLVERCYGDFEGTDPQGDYGDFELKLAQNKAEPLAALHERVLGFLKEIAVKHAGETVLVVAHGGVGRMVQHCYHGERTVRIENGALVKFEGKMLGLKPPEIPVYQ